MLELRGYDRELLASDEQFVVDVIDLLTDEAGDPLFIWGGILWQPYRGEDRIHLSIEAAKPEDGVNVHLHEIGGRLGQRKGEGDRFWSGHSPLFFRPCPGGGLQLVAASGREEKGTILAQLDRDRGIWLVPDLVDAYFDKLYFATEPAAALETEPRARLSELAG